MQSAALRIQAFWRMYTERRAYLAQRQAATILQASWRARSEAARYRELIKQTHAAVVIQRHWRGYHMRSRWVVGWWAGWERAVGAAGGRWAGGFGWRGAVFAADGVKGNGVSSSLVVDW